MKCRRYSYRPDRRFTSWFPGRPRRHKCCTESPRFSRSWAWCWWPRARTTYEALEHRTAEMGTSCARCHKLGHWARECPKGNRGPRNEERCDRRTERPEDNSKGFIGAAGHTARRPFFLRGFLDVRRSRPGTLALGKDSSGNSNWNSGAKC